MLQLVVTMKNRKADCRKAQKHHKVNQRLAHKVNHSITGF